jgi:hypothetical protein
MAKADLECWKKLEEQFKQIHGIFSCDLDDNDQEQARWDARTRNKCNADVSQMAKEMDMLLYSLSPFPQQRGSHTNTSAQRKQKGKRRKRPGKTVSCNVESGDKLIKEEAKDMCARLHSGSRLFVINEVNKDSMEEYYKDEGSTEEDINKETNISEDKHADHVRTGSGGFLVSSPDNDCEGGIDSMIGEGGPIDPQSLCGIAILMAARTMRNARHALDLMAYPCFPTIARVLSILQEKVRTPLWSGSRVLWAVGRVMPIGSSRYM